MAKRKLDWSLDEFVAEQRRSDKRFKRKYDKLAQSERAALAASAKAVQDLVALRRKRKMTQRQVAEALGVTQPYIAKIEKGTEPVGIQILAAYALVVGGRISVIAEKRAPYGE